jgi:hypothetical protein
MAGGAAALVERIHGQAVGGGRLAGRKRVETFLAHNFSPHVEQHCRLNADFLYTAVVVLEGR